MDSSCDIEGRIKEIKGVPFSPVEVARANGQVLRLALFDGEYHWHRHENEDDLFIVYRGEIEVQYRDRPNVRLKEGQVHVVPKGVEHCPKSIVPSYVLFMEPESADLKGD